MFDNPNVEVKARYKIAKYAEGTNPEMDAPFEVIEKEEILTGTAAKELLAGLRKGDEK